MTNHDQSVTGDRIGHRILEACVTSAEHRCVVPIAHQLRVAACQDALGDVAVHAQPIDCCRRRMPVKANTIVNIAAPTSTMLGPDWMSIW